MVLEIDQNAFDVLRFVNSISGSEVVRSDISRKENQLEGMKRELEMYIENLKGAQRLDSEIKTMRGDIQRLQEEVQELESEIAKEIGIKDFTKIGEDICAKKQEILYFEERLRRREGEVKRYRDQYEKTHTLYERLKRDIDDFEQRFETKSIEDFTGKIQVHERRKKDLKVQKDLLDDLWGVVDKAYKIFGESERVILERARDSPLFSKTYELLGNPGECPVCGGNVVLELLDKRRRELREHATDISVAMHREGEYTKSVKADRKELREKREVINSKRRERDIAKREAEAHLNELNKYKDISDEINDEIAEREHERKRLEDDYKSAAMIASTESKDHLNELRKKIEAFETEIGNNQKEIDRLTSVIPDYPIGAPLEKYAKKKEQGLGRLRSEIEELKDEWEHEVFGAVDLFNKNINDIYKAMGFTTFRKIEITKNLVRDRLNSLDVKVEHESGKVQSLSSLSKAEQLTLGIVFQISAKENYIPDFPFFVIDDNMNTFDPDRSESIMKYLSDKAEYVLVSEPVPPSEQGELAIRYGSS
jgi:chromosome segregation ATPase